MTVVTFLGGGNMSSAIVGGMISQGFPSKNITITEPNADRRNELTRLFPGARIGNSNAEAIAGSDIVVLAVKPQVMGIVCQEIQQTIALHQPAVISIAAGITIKSLSEALGPEIGIIRVMPNTPALVNEGATGMFGNDKVTTSQREAAESVMKSVSKRLYWVKEEMLIDAVTGVSGSGPAYFFLLMECIADAGVGLGLPEDVAAGLAIQTCIGAGKMAQESDVDTSQLRKRVTSPNGTTQAAITSVLDDGMRDMWKRAVKAAFDRGQELGKSKL